jgi:hypothetical protein
MGVADRMIQNTITYRTRDQFSRFFDRTDLVDPGSSGSRTGARTQAQPPPNDRPGGEP